MIFLNEMEIPFDRFLRSFYSEKYPPNQVRLEVRRLAFEEEKSKWMKQLEAERTVHTLIIRDLRAELKATTSQKNYRIGKLVSELYSAKKELKDLQKRFSEGGDDRMEEKLFIQEEVASTLKNVIESVVSDKNDSLGELRSKLRKEQEVTVGLEKIIRELKDEKNELSVLYESSRDELAKKSLVEKGELDEVILGLRKEVTDKEERVSTLNSHLSQSKADFQHAVDKFNREKDELASSLAQDVETRENEVLQSQKTTQEALQKLETQLKDDFAAQLSNILNEKDELKSNLNSLQSEIQSLNEVLSETKREKSALEESLKKKSSSEVSSLESERDSILGQLKEVQRERDDKVSNLQNEIDAFTTRQGSLKDILLSNDLNSEDDELVSTLGNHFEKSRNVLENLHAYEQEVESLRKSVQDYEKEIAAKTLDVENECKKNSKLTSLAEEKNKEIKDLRSQLASSSRKDLSATADGLSEVGSTCSITRTDEQERLADCEGYFEERYAKLKILALKLKRKVVELEATRKADKEKILASNTNLSNVQSAFDKLGEEVQEKKSLIRMIESDLKKSVEELVMSKQKVLELQEEASGLKANKQNLKSDLAEGLSKYEILNMEFTTLKTRDGKNTEHISELKQTLESYKDKEELLEKASSMDSELEARLMQIKDLEISSRTKDELIETLESQVQEHVKTKSKLSGDLKTLESSLKDETDNSESIQQKLKECSRQLASLETQLTSKDSKLTEAVDQVELLSLENESLKSRLQSDSLSSAEQFQALCSKNESLQESLSSLKEDIRRKTFALQENEKALGGLQKEFNSYKLRAQSVLRQSKSAESSVSAESGAASEKSQYERTIQHLNDKIEVLRNKLMASDLDKNHLQEDHDRLMQRHSSLLDEMAAKEIAARRKHDELAALANAAKANCEEVVNQSKLKMEEKVQFYENALQVVRSNNSLDISRLQKQIDDLDNKNLMLQLSISQMEDRRQSSPLVSKECSPHLLEREAPEGSVSNASRQASPALLPCGGDRSPMPLEQLLHEAPPEDTPKALNKTTTTVLVRDEEAIKVLEKKIIHLSGLLSESESENHRMVELVEALKEEIRTYRRSEDRIKHIEHQEYVKNVILKFMTMSENEGRKQLLPIVSKLLVLSPEEVKSIEVMLDESVSQSRDANNGSWPSYFGYLMSTDP